MGGGIVRDWRKRGFHYRGCYLHVIPVQFKGLKDLLKEIADSGATNGSNLNKHIDLQRIASSSALSRNRA